MNAKNETPFYELMQLDAQMKAQEQLMIDNYYKQYKEEQERKELTTIINNWKVLIEDTPILKISLISF